MRNKALSCAWCSSADFRLCNGAPGCAENQRIFYIALNLWSAAGQYGWPSIHWTYAREEFIKFLHKSRACKWENAYVWEPAAKLSEESREQRTLLLEAGLPSLSLLRDLLDSADATEDWIGLGTLISPNFNGDLLSFLQGSILGWGIAFFLFDTKSWCWLPGEIALQIFQRSQGEPSLLGDKFGLSLLACSSMSAFSMSCKGGSIHFMKNARSDKQQDLNLSQQVQSSSMCHFSPKLDVIFWTKWVYKIKTVSVV